MATPAASANSKSGLRKLAPAEVLFNDGEPADSLFIIQKGQLRLYKPKGRGFVEIAVLRTGEVIGEMAFFDDDGGGRRSCSAAAMTSSEIIEISFTAFAKTMSSLNPWFKTIINTLANRLRKTNARVKELESNSVAIDYGTGKQGEYEFMKPLELVKMLGAFFLVLKAHGKTHPMGTILDKKTLLFYTSDIFSLLEVKLDSLLLLLQQLEHVLIDDKGDGEATILVKNIEMIRHIFLHLNTERFLEEGKKLKVSSQCEMFLEKISEHIKKVNPNVEAIEIVINPILKFFEERSMKIGIANLADAQNYGICAEPLVDDTGTVRLQIDVEKLNKSLPIIKFNSMMKKANQEKTNY
ncbi:MAG: cyclic nucleotide-binding domain-containing protein [Bacteriovoracaceae bacterium]|nr:cyclic nucleotide-binding domain-containing protein [Bacteriovoracaceae bacterium]